MEGREAVGSWVHSAGRAQCQVHPHPYSSHQHAKFETGRRESPDQ